MGIIKKVRSLFKDNSCSKCYEEMEEVKRQLFILPITVGHYVRHQNAQYYKDNLIPVEKKADIPTGVYACGVIKYQCMNCNHKTIKVSIFLPVRNQEKYEDTIFFENGELDDLF